MNPAMEKLKRDPTPEQLRQDPATIQTGTGSLQARTSVVVLTASALLALLYVFWIGRVVFVLIFAGLLLAVMLDSAASWLEKQLHIRRRWSLPLVVMGVAAGLGFGIWLRGPAVAAQIDQLQERLPIAAKSLVDSVGARDWGRWLVAHGFGPDHLPRAIDMLPRLTGALSTTLGFMAGLLIIIFLGITIAAEPQTYRRGVERLFPSSLRASAASVMDNVGRALRWWLVARLVSMCAVGIMVTFGLMVLRIPLAATLGALAALLTFIPNVGPFLSAIPPVLLAFSSSSRQALFVVLLFWAVHALEGFLITPIAERAAVHLPPALTLSAQLLLAVIIGPIGIALAAPLTTAGMVLVRSVYLTRVLKE
jgi:predicted PurR-regulated permease PerM